MNIRILTLIVVSFIAVWPLSAMAKISAYHSTGAVVLGPSTDTCNATTNVGSVAYTTGNDTLCYCDGLLWKPFPNGPSNYGLKAYWQLNSDASDKTGNGNTGTTHGAPTFVAGEIGNAISLNGSTQYVTVADAASLRSTTFTLAAWVNASSVTGTRAIIEKATAGGADNYFMELASGLQCGFNTGGTFHQYNAAYTFATGTWYHVACTYDGAHLALYVNGVQLASNAETHTPDTTATGLALGISPYNSLGNIFSGKLDDVRFYNRALSAVEIANIYAYTGACP